MIVLVLKMIQLTPNNSNPSGEIKKGLSYRKFKANEEISKWVGKECKYHAHFTSRTTKTED